MFNWKHESNAFLHGLKSGTGFARFVMAPFRWAYDRRYRERHRFPRLVFAFDLALVGVILALLVIVISIQVRPPVPPTLRLSVESRPIVALDAVPFFANITSADGKDHADVAVRWIIPSGWEVLGSNPPLNEYGTAYLGELSASGRGVSMVILRPFAGVGEDSTVFFEVSHIVGGSRQTFDGMSTVTVASSALTAEIPEVVRSSGVVPEGAVIPLVVSNASTLLIPAAELRPSDAGTIRFPRIVLGDLPPHASRLVYVPLGKLEGSNAVFGWSTYSASRAIAHGEIDLRVSAWDAPTFDKPITSRANATTTFIIGGGTASDVIVIVPAESDGSPSIRSFPVFGSSTAISVPPAPKSAGPETRLLVIPVTRSTSGDRVLGPGTFGSFLTSFPFSVDVRYTSTAGDQIGAGPNPPKAGDQTRYWVFARLGPAQNALRDIRVNVSLGSGVTPTGNIALPDGGSSSISGGTVTWKLPRLDAQSAEASFGFEVSITPDASDTGKPFEIVSSARATAKSDSTGATLEAEEGIKETESVSF